MKIKIISGGQVGADRGGLDFALQYGLEMGGWCPKGRMAEDGAVPDVYPLKETPNPNYPERTKWNIRDSDGTVIFSKEPMGRGSALTATMCKNLEKPYLVITHDTQIFKAVASLLGFLRTHSIKTLNVAGSRDRAYYDLALRVLSRAWLEIGKTGARDPLSRFVATPARGS